MSPDYFDDRDGKRCPHCNLRRDVCSSCGAPIVWALTVKGKRYALDFRLVTIAAAFENLRKDRGVTHLDWTKFPVGNIQGHEPHIITCRVDGKPKPGAIEPDGAVGEGLAQDQPRPAGVGTLDRWSS